MADAALPLLKNMSVDYVRVAQPAPRAAARRRRAAPAIAPDDG